MADIAREAGVALQSVYSAGQSKADLLHLVTDLAVAGDGQEVMLVDRPEFVAVAAEPDPVRQVQMLASLIAATMERLAPVWIAYREAAAVDPKAAANLVAAHRRRRETFRIMIRMVPEAAAASRPTSGAPTPMWAIGSIDVFLLQRTVLEWDATAIRRNGSATRSSINSSRRLAHRELTREARQTNSLCSIEIVQLVRSRGDRASASLDRVFDEVEDRLLRFGAAFVARAPPR